MQVSGFRLLHSGGYKRGGRLGQIIDVTLGFPTNYALIVKIEQKSGIAALTFANPLSFRVQDERDLMDYWFARSQENVPVGVVYTIEQSPYRSEFSATISGQTNPFTHYLIAGDDLCVEVLSNEPPQFPAEW